MNLADILSSDPEVMSGNVVFKGTRVPFSVLLNSILDNESLSDFLHNFPTVDRDQVANSINALNFLVQQSIKKTTKALSDSITDRTIAALDRSIVKSADFFSSISEGSALWWAPESIISTISTIEVGSEFDGEGDVRIRPEFSTHHLSKEGVVIPSDTRSGRIDLVVTDLKTSETILVEFKKYVNFGVTRDDFRRIVSIVISNPLKCRGLLVGPIYQTNENRENWPTLFDIKIREIQDIFPNVRISRNQTNFIDGLFWNGKTSLHCVAAVIVEVSA